MAADASNTPFTYAHRADNYTYRVPTPPRIVVPPPALNADALPDITLNALRETNFLNSANYKNLVTHNALLEWTYERRREAQMILPYLYLGPITSAKDETWLRREGITMLLGVSQKHTFGHKVMLGALRKAEEMGLERRTVELANNQDLIHSFPTTTELINSHLAASYQATGKLGKVLVFCESGNERSAGVVAAYLMETHVDVDHIKAMQLCQAQRFCVNFDDALKRLLQGYWDMICARRMVAAHRVDSTEPVNDGGGGSGTSKRGFARDEEDGMDGVEADDMERFGGRTFAPFVDQPL